VCEDVFTYCSPTHPLRPLSHRRITITMDSNVPNHWETLASSLGVEPPVEEPQPKQAGPSAAQQPATPKSATPTPHRAKPAGAPRQAANWDVLASELGIAPLVNAAPVAASVPEPAAPVGSVEKVQPEGPEESPNFFDERFDFEEPFDLLEAGESSPAVASGAEGAMEQVEQPPRKHRRRRRGRGGERPKTHEEAAPALGDEKSADMASATSDESGHEPRLRESVRAGAREAGEGTEGEATREHKVKRRRSRRGRKRREMESPAAAEEGLDVESLAAAAHADNLHDLESDVVVGEGLELSEGTSSGPDESGRFGFRGIPTWQDAIGILVTRNLEARARRSGGGPQQTRSDRSSRDSRSHGGKRRS
jgi:hypothetical protein